MMPFRDLRSFIDHLEGAGQLVRIRAEVDPRLEVTEILSRLARSGGPAVLFEKVAGSRVPIVANLYGTIGRIAAGLGTDEPGLTEIGRFLAYLQHPDPPEGLIEAVKKLPFFARILTLSPRIVRQGPCQEVVLKGEAVDLEALPILHCWPEDAGRLITWPLVITRGPQGGPHNVGIYRMQVIGPDRAIMGWLRQRGGNRHYQEWMALNRPMPVAVVIGCDPATTIAAVTPVPERMSEFHFAGLLRRKPVDLVRCRTIDLEVPATAEIVLEGEIAPGEMAQEGFHGDHTGYYHPGELLPVFRITCITHRQDPIYHTTVTGRPPREDAMVGLALGRIFLPILQQHFPEIVDFHLPMEALSYRMAIVAIKKSFPGHARRVMLGLWGFLKQFLYVKYIIVVDPEINVRRWEDVVWSLATRVDPARDTMILENTPFDYLDFATPKRELGSKMGIDATTKHPPEVERDFERLLRMDPEVVERVTRRWKELGLPDLG